MIFKAKKKSHGKIPWGYDVHPDDPELLVPDHKALTHFEEAKTWIKVASYREVARWLSEKTGRYISHVALADRIKREDGEILKVANIINTANKETNDEE